jgi:dTDP-4-amino-4,6-dideoxygalactose transaminase
MYLFKIPLTKALLDKNDIAVVEQAVGRGAISQGSIASLFEQEFSRFLGMKGGVATNSCTSALLLALKTLGVGQEDEVVLPSYTCLAVLHAVVQAGARPVLTDNCCNPLDMNYNMTAETIRRVLNSRTRAIIVPHMFGVPAEIDEIINFGVPVIEDITLSLGARHKGQPVGSWGAMSVCSFHASKMIACGEGGMLTASTKDLHEKACYLNGWETEQMSARFSPAKKSQYELRYNFHMSDLAAALGMSQLAQLPKFLERRKELAGSYDERLSRLKGVVTPAIDARENVFFRYLVFLKDRDLIEILKSYAQAGIEAGRGVYPALHCCMALADPVCFPGAEKAMGGVLSIPLYPALRDEEVEHILQTTERVLSR